VILLETSLVAGKTPSRRPFVARHVVEIVRRHAHAHQSRLVSQVTVHLQFFYRLLLLFGLLLTSKSVSLGLDSLLSSLTGSLGLRTLGVHFFLEDSLTLFLGLGFVNMFDQSTLVLEGVTLAQLIELMVKVLVNLASSPVLGQKASKDTQTSHP